MRIARPLYELVGVTRQIGAGRLEARAQLECGGLDELATLARAVNDTADRIGKQLRDQRELLGGVSHELRTPARSSPSSRGAELSRVEARLTRPSAETQISTTAR